MKPDPSYGRRVSLVMELMQGEWTVQILCAMRNRSVRLSELRRVLPSASKKGLTTSLRSLEAAKIIVRRDLSASVLRVEYELSELIRPSLVELLDHLAEWGDFYEAVRAKPNIADRHSGGKNE
jgi:DNA-binding HxlR family transcriptional regulator